MNKIEQEIQDDIKDLTKKKLRSLRALKGYGQQFMADFLEIRKPAYSMKETGKRAFNKSEMQKIAELFSSTVDEIFFAKEVNTK